MDSAVHSLLHHLEDVGFEGAPRVLGVDAEGREVLSYLPSDPTPNWSDDALVAVGRLVGQLHDALAGYVPPADAVWRYPPVGRRTPGGPIGHNDLCPVNTAYANGVPYGFFDWDMAGPFRPNYDLALAAIAFTPLRPDRYFPRPGCPGPPRPRRPPPAVLRRLRAEDRLALLATIEAFQQESPTETLELGGRGISPFGTFLAHGEDRFRRLELPWLAQNRDALGRALL